MGNRSLTRRTVVHPLLRQGAFALLGLTAVVLAIGTVVTGSGPHSGDVAAGRTGLDPGAVSQLHADAVMLLVGATAGLWLALRATGATAAARGHRAPSPRRVHSRSSDPSRPDTGRPIAPSATSRSCAKIGLTSRTLFIQMR